MKTKKIVATIAATLSISSANAIEVHENFGGTVNSHSLKEPFSYTTTNGTSTTGTWNVDFIHNTGFFTGGTLTLNYNIQGSFSGNSYNVTYTNVTYNLSSSSVIGDISNPTGWVATFGWGYSKGNSTSWGSDNSQTIAAGKPTAVMNTNGTYWGYQNGNNLTGGNGSLSVAGGSSSCIGSGCNLWGANSFGLEGLTLIAIADPRLSFAVTSAKIILQDVIGTTAPFQIETSATYGPFQSEILAFEPATAVPIPAAAWLMGSSIIGLLGIKRYRK